MTDAAARNRALMPHCLGEIAPAFRGVFGSLKIEFVREKGNELGKPPVFSGVFVSTADMPSLDLQPTKEKK